MQAVPPHVQQKTLVTLDGDELQLCRILCMSHCRAAVGPLHGVVGDSGFGSHKPHWQ